MLIKYHSKVLNLHSWGTMLLLTLILENNLKLLRFKVISSSSLDHSTHQPTSFIVSLISKNHLNERNIIQLSKVDVFLPALQTVFP